MLRRIAVCMALAPLVACASKNNDDSGENVVAGDASRADAAEESAADASARDAGSTLDSSEDAGAASSDAAALDAAQTGALDAAGDAAEGGALDAANSDASQSDSGDANLADASTTDAGSDAEVPKGFSITVRQGTSRPVAQAPVFFHDANGAVVSEHTTGADGRVTAMPAPAMVTVIGPKLNNVEQVFTLTQLAAGDDLVLELPDETAPTDQPGFKVRVEGGAALPGNTAQVAVYGGIFPCAGAVFTPANSYTLPWPSNCELHNRNSLLAIAFASNLTPTAYATGKGFAPFGASASEVALSGWSSPVNVTLTVKNLPTGSAATASLLLWAENDAFDPLAQGPRVLAKGNATRTYTWPTPANFSDAQSLGVNVDGTSPGQVSSLRTRGAVSAAPELDFATALPFVSCMALDRTTPLRPIAKWSSVASGAATAVGTVAMIEWPNVADWVIVAPSSAGSATWPDLPANRRAFFNPNAKPTLYVSHFASSRAANYRTFLAQPVRPLVNGPFHLLGRDLAADSSERATSCAAP